MIANGMEVPIPSDALGLMVLNVGSYGGVDCVLQRYPNPCPYPYQKLIHAKSGSCFVMYVSQELVSVATTPRSQAKNGHFC